VVSATSRQLYPREGDPISVIHEVGPVWRVPNTGIRSWDPPAGSELLYRLRCHGPCYVSKRNMVGTCKLNREVLSCLDSTRFFQSKLCCKTAMKLRNSEKCDYWSSEESIKCWKRIRLNAFSLCMFSYLCKFRFVQCSTVPYISSNITSWWGQRFEMRYYSLLLIGASIKYHGLP
jgi:hypothetical protein